jgi:hypothetical protein
VTHDPFGPRLQAPSVDLDMLASVLDGDPNRSEGGYLDLSTGETWPSFAFDEDDDFDPDDDRWHYVPCQGSRESWQDMQDFIDGHVSDPALAVRLGDAISSRGAFRRFGTVLRDHDEIQHTWLRFKDQRAQAQARKWLLGQGFLDRP